MSTPTATLTIFNAYNQYLDELSWLTTHAHRCPLGLSDPDSPLRGGVFRCLTIRGIRGISNGKRPKALFIRD